MYIYACMYIHTHIYRCIYIHMYTHTHACVHTYIYTYIHIHIHTHTPVAGARRKSRKSDPFAFQPCQCGGGPRPWDRAARSCRAHYTQHSLLSSSWTLCVWAATNSHTSQRPSILTMLRQVKACKGMSTHTAKACQHTHNDMTAGQDMQRHVKAGQGLWRPVKAGDGRWRHCRESRHVTALERGLLLFGAWRDVDPHGTHLSEVSTLVSQEVSQIPVSRSGFRARDSVCSLVCGHDSYCGLGFRV